MNVRRMASGKKGRFVVGAFALFGLAVLVHLWRAWTEWVSTDDAFLDSRIVQVAPSIAGRVLAVTVSDNEHVEAGRTLVEIDPADANARVDAARADLRLAEAASDSARASLEASRLTTAAAIDRAKAGLAAAEARVTEAEAEEQAAASQAAQAGADLARYRKLAASSISEQQRDLAGATAKSTAARLEAARKNVLAARAAVGAAHGDLAAAEAAPHEIAVHEADVAKAEAAKESRRAMLREAELDLSHTRIVAVEAGRVTRKTVQAGNYVMVGQTMMALVSDERWVVANLKETQLDGVAVGAEAELHVDAYPDVTFHGHVDSVQTGSGSRFSLLPAENATGNYVKVVQRVPVKIVFNEQPDPARYVLGPGMSVEPDIRVR